jgi:hypothetical protein
MLEAMFRDAFDRTTTSGLGTADDGTVYSAVGGDDYAHVDGSKVVQTSSSQSRYSGMPRVATGAVQFDFFTTSSRSDPNLAYQVDGGWELQNPGHYYHLFGTESNTTARPSASRSGSATLTRSPARGMPRAPPPSSAARS